MRKIYHKKYLVVFIFFFLNMLWPTLVMAADSVLPAPQGQRPNISRNMQFDGEYLVQPGTSKVSPEEDANQISFEQEDQKSLDNVESITSTNRGYGLRFGLLIILALSGLVIIFIVKRKNS